MSSSVAWAGYIYASRWLIIARSYSGARIDHCYHGQKIKTARAAETGQTTFGEGTPDWMYRVPPFRMLDPGDHMMDRYVKHAKTWAEAAKAGVADVE